MHEPYFPHVLFASIISTIIIMIMSAVGFAVSLYAYYVERNLRRYQNYKALCDLSDVASCTKPLLSPYGKLLGFSNSILGMLFYASMMIASVYHYLLWRWYEAYRSAPIGVSHPNLDLQILGVSAFMFCMAIAAILASLVFAYLLYFKIRSFCLICTSIYVINILLLYFTYHQLIAYLKWMFRSM